MWLHLTFFIPTPSLKNSLLKVQPPKYLFKGEKMKKLLDILTVGFVLPTWTGAIFMLLILITEY